MYTNMIIRILLLALAACGAGIGALRIEQLMQAPVQRAQRIGSLTVDSQGNLIVTGSNVQGGFVSKLDPSGNVVFTFSVFGAYPAATAVDTNGDCSRSSRLLCESRTSTATSAITFTTTIRTRRGPTIPISVF